MPDVFTHFAFNTTHSTTCCKCDSRFSTEATQLYLELQVPDEGSDLNSFIEEEYMCSLITKKCDEVCKSTVQAEKSTKLTSGKDTEFLTILLSRATGNPDDYRINTNKIKAFNDVWIR